MLQCKMLLKMRVLRRDCEGQEWGVDVVSSVRSGRGTLGESRRDRAAPCASRLDRGRAEKGFPASTLPTDLREDESEREEEDERVQFLALVLQKPRCEWSGMATWANVWPELVV
jgi:hypothetical protein